jgi:hypothetical protein
MQLRSFASILTLTILVGVVLTGCALATKAPPRADAGPDVIAHVGERVSYDGSLSVDLDGGKIVYYHWRVASAPEGREEEIGRVLHEGEDAAVWSTDTPLAEQDVGEWVIELKVTDDEGQSATDDLALTVAR